MTTPARLFRPLLCAPLLACAATAALAQTRPAEPQLTPGQQVVLASYYEVSPSGCRALSAPRVTVTQKATLGKVIVMRTEGVARISDPRCVVSALKLPVAQVVYQADKPGVDTMAWEVRYQERRGYKGREQRTEGGSARIRVNPAPAGR